MIDESIEEGDFIRIPQNAMLYSFDENQVVKVFYNTEKPMAAIYLREKYIAGSDMVELLMDDNIWYTIPENIYKWREYAYKNDRSVFNTQY